MIDPRRWPSTPLQNKMWRQSPLTILVLKPGITPENKACVLLGFFKHSSWDETFQPGFPFSRVLYHMFFPFSRVLLQERSQQGLLLAQCGNFREFEKNSWSPCMDQRTPLSPFARGFPFSRKKGNLFSKVFPRDHEMDGSHFAVLQMTNRSILAWCPMSLAQCSSWGRMQCKNVKTSLTFVATGSPKSRSSNYL